MKRNWKTKAIISWMLVIGLFLSETNYVGAAMPVAGETMEQSSANDVSTGDMAEEEKDMSQNEVSDGDISEGDTSFIDVSENDVSENEVSEGDPVSDGNAAVGASGQVLYSGEESGVTWEITDEGVLTIAGEQTAGSDPVSAPWSKYRDEISSAVVTAKNVTSTAGWFYSGSYFYTYNKLNTIDLSQFDTSKVTDMSHMFHSCSALTTLDVSRFDTSKVTNMKAMFMDCRSLTTLDVTSFNTSKVTDMTGMFNGCRSLTTLDVTNFNTSKVADMGGMFIDCRSLKTLDVTNFDTSKVTDMEGMFAGCSSLTTLDVTNFDTKKVKNMAEMFYDCCNLVTLDVTNFDTSNVVFLCDMFSNCRSLTTLDVTNFDTSKAENMDEMFLGCTNLTTLDVSNFDTSKVVSLYEMFSGCSSLTALDVTNFDTSKVDFMYRMFAGCSSLTTLDVTNFDTGNARYMNEMFKGCSSLTTLNVSHFDTSKAESMNNMFTGCTALAKIGCFKNLQLDVALPVTPMYGPDGETYTSFPKGLEQSIWLYAQWNDKPDADGLWAEELADQTYTGNAIKPKPVVYDKDILLVEGRDYTLSYKNNTKVMDKESVKAPTVVIKGKGNYQGTMSTTFSIAPKSIEDEDVQAADITVIANGKLQKKVPVVKWGSKTLQANKDYSIAYEDASPDAYKAPGVYTITITGKNSYNGTRSVTLTIAPKETIPVSKCSIASIAAQPYQDGNVIEPVPVVKYKGQLLTRDVDYTVTYQNNTDVGIAQIVITGLGNYLGSRTVTFKITGKSISKAKLEGLTDKLYDGSEQTQNVDLWLGDTKLVENQDYTISYSKNIHAGTASILVTGKGGYTGTIKKSFKIKAYDLKADQSGLLEGIPEELSVAYVKGGCTPSVALSFGTMALAAGKDYKISYKNNKKPGLKNDAKAPAMVVTGKGDFTGTIEIPFSITKRDLADADNPVAIHAVDVMFVGKPGKYMAVPVLTDRNGKKLTAGTDYEKTYVYSKADGTILTKKDIPQVGDVIQITVTGKGCYTGTAECTYRIAKAFFAKAKISAKAQVYTGEEITLTADSLTVKIGNVKLVEGQDYEIVTQSYKNNVQKGTASVTIRGIGNYGGEKTVSFKIVSRQFIWFWEVL